MAISFVVFLVPVIYGFNCETLPDQEMFPPTESLIRRAQAGDVRAFEELVEIHIDQVRRFARAFARNDHDADDLAQEALIKVYRSLGGFRFQSAFSTWLFTLTKNCFLDALKSRAARERAGAPPMPSDGAATAHAHELLEEEERKRLLWAAIEQVPVEFRTALVLFDIEGLPYDEVAAIEKVALGTVKSRLSRGREHLRRILFAADPERAAQSGNKAQPAPVSHKERPHQP